MHRPSVRAAGCAQGSVITGLVAATLLAASPSLARSQAPLAAAWDSVARILKTMPAPTGGYLRYNFPRRDITLKMGALTVPPALALGTWAGFSGDPSGCTMMGDLVLLSDEVKPVLAELARQNLDVTAMHNHLVGESPQVTYVHYHGEGAATGLAERLDRVLAHTATPRPVVTLPPAAVTIDTAVLFSTLGIRGRAQGNIAQFGVVLVPGDVSMNGQVVNPAMAYGTPINIQVLDANRALASGDFTVLGSKESGVVRALTANGITVTAVHSHLIDETPQLRYIHFWADGPLADVLRGLRAALDAAR